MSESALMNNTWSGCPISMAPTKRGLVIGSNISSICYGIMVFLGFLCFNALRHRETERQTPRVRASLMRWVVATVTVGTITQGWDTASVTAIARGQACEAATLLENPFLTGLNILWLLMDVLTDGLLVWRCYAIASGFNRKWLLAWLVPLAIYIGIIVVGLVLLSVYSLRHKWADLAQILLMVGLGISLFLNIIISSSIVLLLFHYRRMLMRLFGGESGKSYLNLMTILVESASLIILSDVLTLAAVLRQTTILYIPMQTWSQIQAIASLLIIYQVARGVDYFSDKDDVTNHALQNSSAHAPPEVLRSRRNPRRSNTSPIFSAMPTFARIEDSCSNSIEEEIFEHAR
ncbi:hypothetical protein D9756_010560 [Leucocoprinus leucothites]|uniref:Uncharacterized protein n=1 Tax=Leucocoprinus leucothites TaxID=201217 RepID=A0A8H5FRU9_9AGAR|nr:hypothetical protein D9756_010560 [Leucoagaricus leucothites]